MQQWDRPGRPCAADTAARTRELIRHLADGATFSQAAKLARVKPERVLRLLDEPEFRAVAQAVLDGRMGPVAVAV